MIQKCYSLSCFTLEGPYKIQYSHNAQQIVDLYSSNGNIYQFKLPDEQNYQKIVNQQNIQKLAKVDNLWIILDTQSKLVVRKGSSEIYHFDDIQQIEQWQTQNYHFIIVKFLSKNNKLVIGHISKFKNSQSQDKLVLFKEYSLQEISIENQNANLQKLLKFEYNIQRILGNCCIFSNEYNQTIIIQLQLQKINLSSQISIITFHRIDIQLSINFQIINTYQSSILMKSDKQWYLLSIHDQKLLKIQQFQSQNNQIQFIQIQNFIIILDNGKFYIYQSIKGNLMAKIQIPKILDDSSYQICDQLSKTNNQSRYCMIFDKLNLKPINFYLMDKQRMTMYCINIKNMLNEIIYEPILESLRIQKQDSAHQTVIKTINFRTKKVRTLQKYLVEGISSNNFGNATRFLLNQQNIFVLNDGTSLFYNYITLNLQKITRQLSSLIQIQKDMIKLCSKLIESKYQNHIENGLLILNTIYTKFRDNQNFKNLQKNKLNYYKILQSNRIIKLLKQDKKKKLFQLSYELLIKIKGFQQIQKSHFCNNKQKQ